MMTRITEKRSAGSARGAQAMVIVSLFWSQAIFYPEDWWHQTVALDEGGAALTGTLVTPSNGRIVASEMRAECRGANRIIPAGAAQLCAALAPCLDHWESTAVLGDGP